MSSALLTAADQIIPMINENVLVNVNANWKHIQNAEVNVINLCFIGLCVLAKYGNNLSFLNASMMLKLLIEKRNAETLEEVDDEYLLSNINSFIENEEEYEYLDLPDFHFPSDGVDVLEVYRDVAFGRNMFRTLPLELQQEVSELLSEGAN
ncbi:hypothetical protein GPJ56_007075 [Histomonas meleagridis]|uniref:uncharacterized protein n=1 Tax=Histomonas meleagridis TaxID=135588 RepID=UPI0035598C63|nr:hypothetical protein GPJ56_007075 [Histomonas meleagridis]KAH0799788.1 hypothetical protein GO595_007509 [Histomonas meleagridis]